jgi:glutamate synthase (NADPH/NADH) small chain
VPIRALTRFLLDYGWKHGLAEPAVEHSTGQSVAVIGSGIGGLVTADTLSRRGYAVTVFDSRLKPGGRVMNGLPGFRVDKELVERRLESLKRRGIRFQMGVTFGQNVKLSELRREFDAVFLGFGLADAMPLDVPGAELRGVYQSFPYVSQNALPAGQPSVDVRGKRVVVLGGGDTAMDVLRIAIRRGAADALCIYRRDEASLPADAEEYEDAREEGAHSCS